MHGIRVAGATMDVPAMIARKDAIVTKMAQGIEYLFRKNKVANLKGRAMIVGRKDGVFRVAVTRSVSTQEVTARNLVIATGPRASCPASTWITRTSATTRAHWTCVLFRAACVDAASTLCFAGLVTPQPGMLPRLCQAAQQGSLQATTLEAATW